MLLQDVAQGGYDIPLPLLHLHQPVLQRLHLPADPILLLVLPLEICQEQALLILEPVDLVLKLPPFSLCQWPVHLVLQGVAVHWFAPVDVLQKVRMSPYEVLVSKLPSLGINFPKTLKEDRSRWSQQSEQLKL